MENMKYTTPEMEVIKLEVEDVMAASLPDVPYNKFEETEE